VDTDPNWIRIHWVPESGYRFAIRIRIQKGKKLPAKYADAGCSLLRAEACSCSLDVLYGGLGIIAIFDIKKKYKKFPAVFF
jgi:hypothetical protein